MREDASAPGGGLAEARTAVEAGRWADARTALLALPALDQHAEALELLAHAEYGVGDHERTIAAWESLHDLHLQRGEHVDAARAAAMLALWLMMDSGVMASVRGWAGRAERLLVGEDETPVHALIATARTYERFLSGELGPARVEAARAIELGIRHDVVIAQMMGRTATARITLLEGDVDAGLAALEELAVVLLSGEAGPLAGPMLMCELVCAMQGLAQYDRAEEWSAAFESLRSRGFYGSMSGRCRVHRAEVLRMRGDCAAAEDEALRACEELRPWMRREFGWPLAELGTIRLRRGDLAGAEEAFVASLASGWDPQPGLALVRYAQGDVVGAARLVAEALANPLRVPSKERPPIGGLSRAPLLEAQVELALAAGDPAVAAAAAAELRSLAGLYGSRGLEAAASLAEGRVALAAGDAARAVAACASAVDAWCAMGAPYEVAAARGVLAEAHAAAGDDALADVERRASEAGLATIGAVLPRALGATSPAVASPAVAPPVSRTSATVSGPAFVRSGDTRTIRYLDDDVVVRDLVGMRYLARLLASPGREVHVLDLVAIEHGDGRGATGHAEAAEAGLHVGGDAAGPVLDDRARRAYQRRLAEIEEEVADAERHGDQVRAELGRVDRDFLVAELARAFGLGGRERAAGSTAERARTSVTRSVRYALARLAEHAPALADHLGRTVRTGTFCCYDPDPTATPSWEL